MKPLALLLTLLLMTAPAQGQGLAGASGGGDAPPPPIDRPAPLPASLHLGPGPARPAPSPTDERPRIAVVIDDLGVLEDPTRAILALPGPLTASFLPYANNLTTQTAAARAAGHEVMLHLPMEALDASVDPGPHALRRNQDNATLDANVAWNLARFGGYVGVNNHTGSAFTAHAPGMRRLMDHLRQRNLFFLDSLTSPRSRGEATATQAGVPVVVRDVFLDHRDHLPTIRKQLATVEARARQHGQAIAIGHPRDNTLAALRTWLPTLAQKGFRLVPVSLLVREKYPAFVPHPAPDPEGSTVAGHHIPIPETYEVSP